MSAAPERGVELKLAPPRLPRTLDVVVALSVANLFLVEVWARLLSSPASWYFFGVPPSRVDYLAALANLLLLAGLAFGMMQLARRTHHVWLLRLAAGLLLIALLIPLNFLRKHWSVTSITFADLPGGPYARLGLVLLGLFIVARWPLVLGRGAALAVVPLAAFALTTTGRGVWALATAGPPPPSAHCSGGPRPGGHRPGARVVIVVFDELDQRLVFEKRPAGLALPELDRLRGESLAASQARPPAGDTLRSLPGLTTGLRVAKARPLGTSDLELEIEGKPQPQRWSAAENLFRAARRRGARTGLTGWYHPYPRVLGKDLDACVWEAYGTLGAEASPVLPLVMLNQLESVLPWTVRARHVAIWRGTTEPARAMAADRGLGLVFLHLSVPHSPWIYDRRSGAITLVNTAGPRGYFDNVALTDRTLGMLRQSMETAGLWDSAHVIVTSDHGWRSSGAYDQVVDDRVPLLIKIAGSRSATAYDRPLNTTLLPALCELLSEATPVTPARLGRWLDTRAGDGRR